MSKIRKFSDLRAWQEAHDLVLFVYSITDKFPSEEKFGLANQSRRASVSITSNIAEGFGRRTAKDKKHFYLMSKTSLAELETQFIIACDLGYFAREKFDLFSFKCVNVGKLIAGLIKSADNI